MSSAKRPRLSADVSSEGPVSGSESDNEEIAVSSASEVESIGDEDEESLDTEDEIAEAQTRLKSKKTQKRKRRATSPSHFGATLRSLLNTDAPTKQPLSLNPSIAKKRADETLEIKGKKLLEGERKEKEEKNHVKDVIGEWGGEGERSLRKVAQRGVVKLFNAIHQTQVANIAEQEEALATRGSGKPTLPAPVFDSKTKKKHLGPSSVKRSEGAMQQDAFLQMIKSGGIVSRT